MFNDDFYPTPDSLIEKLIEGINFHEITNLLEPSGGKGNILDYIKTKANNSSRYSPPKINIDCIEIDTNLRYILQSKGYRVVYDDFLTYNTLKNYSHIIANFPFSDGDKHLRKALSMLETSGGKLRCIVNAETVRNPYSNLRKEIIKILDKNNAKIEYLQNEFSNAERKTNVEIAIIKVDIERQEVGSIILDTLKQAQLEEENTYESKYVSSNNFLDAIITQYEFECKVGISLIDEYKKLESFTKSSFDENSTILSLRLSDDRSYSEPHINNLKNDYLKKVRYKYWKALFNNKEFTKLFTTNLQRDFYNKLSELADYDFNEFNINEIKNQLNNQVITGVKETILNLFDELSHKHYYAEMSNNIHMFNGWKSNSCYKINKKVIIPLNGYGEWNGAFNPTHYTCIDKLLDIEKVFNYLDTGKTEELTLRDILNNARENYQTKGIMTKFFKIDFYKKGTAHFTFLDEELLKKFNVFGCRNKGWIPPSYGKATYSEMTKEEQDVIDNFEGEKEYNKVMNNKDYYLYNEKSILMLN